MNCPGPECLSPYAVEKAVSDRGWPAPLTEEQQAHLARCPLCAAMIGRAQAEEAEFRRTVLPDGLPELARRLGQRRHRVFLASVAGGAGLAVAAAAALFLFVLPPAWMAGGPDASQTGGTAHVPGSGERAAYTGLKAACSLVLYVKRGQSVFRHEPGTPLLPGDAVRVVPVAPDRSWMLLFHRDAAGEVQVVYPWEGESSGPLPPPGEPVAGAFELDGRAGGETWMAAFSDTPIPAKVLAARLRTGELAGPGRLDVAGQAVDVVFAAYAKVVQ